MMIQKLWPEPPKQFSPTVGAGQLQNSLEGEILIHLRLDFISDGKPALPLPKALLPSPKCHDELCTNVCDQLKDWVPLNDILIR